jgi:hypothetical protein
MIIQRPGETEEIVAGAFRILATSIWFEACPVADMPWQARVDVFRHQDTIPSFSMVLADWYANSQSAKTVALNYGIYAARMLPVQPNVGSA